MLVDCRFAWIFAIVSCRPVSAIMSRKVGVFVKDGEKPAAFRTLSTLSDAPTTGGWQLARVGARRSPWTPAARDARAEELDPLVNAGTVTFAAHRWRLPMRGARRAERTRRHLTNLAAGDTSVGSTPTRRVPTTATCRISSLQRTALRGRSSSQPASRFRAGRCQRFSTRTAPQSSFTTCPDDHLTQPIGGGGRADRLRDHREDVMRGCTAPAPRNARLVLPVTLRGRGRST